MIFEARRNTILACETPVITYIQDHSDKCVLDFMNQLDMCFANNFKNWPV